MTMEGFSMVKLLGVFQAQKPAETAVLGGVLGAAEISPRKVEGSLPAGIPNFFSYERLVVSRYLEGARLIFRYPSS